MENWRNLRPMLRWKDTETNSLASIDFSSIKNIDGIEAQAAAVTVFLYPFSNWNQYLYTSGW